LSANNISHCDIKGANVVIVTHNNEKRLKLIDADCLTDFGKAREVCSPGHNINREDYARFRKKQAVLCNDMTDDEGFKKLIEYVSLKGDELAKLKELQKKNYMPQKLEEIREVEDEDTIADGEGVSDFVVNQSKVETLYYTYIAAKLCKGLDIVIMLDLTGSMGPSIAMAKETIVKIIDFMKERYSQSTVRFAFVGYRDFCDGEKRLVKRDFSSDTEGLKTLIGE